MTSSGRQGQRASAAGDGQAPPRRRPCGLQPTLLQPAVSSVPGASGAAELARIVVEQLCGWKLDEAKRVTAVSSTTILGISVAIKDGWIHFEVPAEKAHKWREGLHSVLQSGRPSPLPTPATHARATASCAGGPQRRQGGPRVNFLGRRRKCLAEATVCNLQSPGRRGKTV